MLQRKTHRLAALTLALLMALAPASMAAVETGAAPDGSINWGKVAGYVECGVMVYMAVGSGGAAGVLAVAVCAHVMADESKLFPWS
jgi:hypothetical protein